MRNRNPIIVGRKILRKINYLLRNCDFTLMLYHTNVSENPYAVTGDTVYVDSNKTTPFFSGSFLAHNQKELPGPGFAIVTNEEGLVLAFNCE